MLPALLLLLTLLPGAAAAPNYAHRPKCIVLFEAVIYEPPLETTETALAVAKPTDLTVRKTEFCFYPKVTASPKKAASNSVPTRLPGPIGQSFPVFNSSKTVIEPVGQLLPAPVPAKAANSSPSMRLIAPLAVNTVQKAVASINRTELESIRSQNRQGLEMMFSSECLFRLAILLLTLNLFFFEILGLAEETTEDEVSRMSRSVQTDDDDYLADDEMTTASAISEEDVFAEAEQVLQDVLSELDEEFIYALVQEQAVQINRLHTISERSEPSDAEAHSDSDC